MRSHVNHVRKIMALRNHLGTFMCRVFPLSLGKLGLKWFDKVSIGSIGSFHLFIESFVARFVINIKAPNGVSSLLTL